jgi:hypothetical protein
MMFRIPSIVILCLTLLLGLPGAALARQSLATYTPGGRPLFVFDIFDAGESFADGNSYPSVLTLGPGYLEAMQSASDYWSALLGSALRNTAPVRILVQTLPEPDYAAISNLFSPSSRHSEPSDVLLNNAPPSDDFSAILYIGDYGQAHFGPLSVLPANGSGHHISSIIAHELGHALDIGGVDSMSYDGSSYRFGSVLTAWEERLYDSFGNQAKPGMEIAQGTAGRGDAFVIDSTGYYVDPDTNFFIPGGFAFFQGKNTLETLDGWVMNNDGGQNPNQIAGVPINGFEPGDDCAPFPELGHPEMAGSMMSHQNYRNWGTFMEVELAMLQDIGVPIDRKNFFGRSLYTDSGDHDLELGFYARNAEGTAYLPGQYNTAPFSVGLHVYGFQNTLHLSGESLSSGYGGVGIRVDGSRTDLSLTPGTRIHALGENGTGLMVAWGQYQEITQRGEILATGPGGVGARFDFGSNMLGSGTEYQGSYIRQWGGYREESFLDELVTRFDVSGTLAGSAAAIYISDNAYVQNINVMNGAGLFGDIISDWDPGNPLITYNDDPPHALTTALTFGLTPDADGMFTSAADADFFLDYRGDVTGAKSLNVSLEGGTLAYGGDMDVLSFTAASGSTLLATPSAGGVTIAAPTIDLQPGSTLGLYTNAVTYGAPLAGQHSLLRFEGDITDNLELAALPAETFIHGFHDYSPTSLEWDGRELVLGSTRSLSQERTAASALTAPMAIMAQSPYADVLRDRALSLFAQASRPNSVAASAGGSGGEAVSLWASQGYGYARRHGAGSYKVRAPGLALGADRQFGGASFLGAGVYLASPAYRSNNADLDAKSFTGMVYGGTSLPLSLEVDAFAAVGHSRYDQRRSVHGERYDADYSGKQASAGFSLGRSFEVGTNLSARPFAAYELTRLNVEGYDEGDAGLFGLRVKGSRSDWQRLQAGTALTYTLENGFVTGRVFYSGLYGDRQAEAEIALTRDPSGYSLRSQGWAQDEHAAGLALDFGLSLGESTQLSGGYSFTGGKDITAHQGELTFSLSF